MHSPLHSVLTQRDPGPALSFLRALAWARDTAREGLPLGSVSSSPFHKSILDCCNWEYFSSLRFLGTLSEREPLPFALCFSYTYPCPVLSQAAPSSRAGSRPISLCPPGRLTMCLVLSGCWCLVVHGEREGGRQEGRPARTETEGNCNGSDDGDDCGECLLLTY